MNFTLMVKWNCVVYLFFKNEPDVNGQMRKVVKFPLRIKDGS